MVIGITWKKTYPTWRMAGESGAQATLVTLLLRDGTVYFVVLLLLNVIYLIAIFVEDAAYAISFVDVYEDCLHVST
ncbi:hypothetical protein BV20DRAFT_1124140 [Pilatotrama ljubarskyi]|nr:hypothetical protein BV20DRAFT_1124140 [Pilatotrama ljubarskyi]